MKRIKWVDDVKTIACILVVLGHFFQSMVKSGIINDNYIYQLFNHEIYLFHVNLFFICSGYIYQRKYIDSGVIDRRSKVIVSKFYSLIIPMIVFASITWMLKYVAGESVNVGNQSFLQSVLITPTAPYWFLQTLFIIFVITPQLKDNIGYALIIIASILLRICSYYISGMPQVIHNVMTYEMWFVLGMLINKVNMQKLNLKKIMIMAYIMLGVFLLTSIWLFNNNINQYGIILGFLACTSIIILTMYYESINRSNMVTFDMIKKYMFPIYLMHTIFAAPIRILLIKLGISNVVVQLLCGIAISFAGPIIYMKIASLPKMNWMKWLVYPHAKIKE